ncbi:MAG: hypothetical protein ACI4U2_05385, partial [Christensenellaceae bacterium]
MKGLFVRNTGLRDRKFNEIADLFAFAFACRGVVLEQKFNDEILTLKDLPKYDFCIFYDKDVAL